MRAVPRLRRVQGIPFAPSSLVLLRSGLAVLVAFAWSPASASRGCRSVGLNLKSGTGVRGSAPVGGAESREQDTRMLVQVVPVPTSTQQSSIIFLSGACSNAYVGVRKRVLERGGCRYKSAVPVLNLCNILGRGKVGSSSIRTLCVLFLSWHAHMPTQYVRGK